VKGVMPDRNGVVGGNLPGYLSSKLNTPLRLPYDLVKKKDFYGNDIYEGNIARPENILRALFYGAESMAPISVGEIAGQARTGELSVSSGVQGGSIDVRGENGHGPLREVGQEPRKENPQGIGLFPGGASGAPQSQPEIPLQTPRHNERGEDLFFKRLKAGPISEEVRLANREKGCQLPPLRAVIRQGRDPGEIRPGISHRRGPKGPKQPSLQVRLAAFGEVKAQAARDQHSGLLAHLVRQSQRAISWRAAVSCFSSSSDRKAFKSWMKRRPFDRVTIPAI